MSILVQSRKILWGRSGNRCAFPGCYVELHQEVGNSSSTLIGEECHIEAQSGNGPRFNKDLTEKQINSFENLILLCPNHHKIIDDNPDEYPVERLKKMKADHESQVRKALDDKSEFDDMYYESVVYYIDMMLEFDNWDAWTSYLLSADGPKVSEEMLDSIEKIKQYILGRVWFGKYPDLEEAIKNLRNVLIDLVDVFNRHSEQNRNWYITEKFYKIRPYDAKAANKLLEEYHQHVLLVDNLTYEMTRTANLICDLTRKYIDHSYRLAEGKLLSYDKCPEYRAGEIYPGLDEFKKICRERDVYF